MTQSLYLPEHVGFLIRRAQQVHLAVWAEEAGPGLSNVQFGVLNVLHRTGGASQRELCDVLDLDRSTVAGLVSRLEARGLVERTRAAADRRRNLVRLTDDGAAELRRLVPHVAQVDASLTAGLSEEERATLRRLLTRVLDAHGHHARDDV
ncbi:MarR family winged helix-turn-helix transcriptional regulator [Promicromonospora soli]|jgi:DNA-binding MarR family transcriptional regulator|uniref:Transcriptional regulator n=1 Tax=Promicromonospora soli TaxID=2035533 RepID=A0A919L2D9_9MICO|nr:MarR family winged helix-turn-helix transcriptional regulator [Promicromonospora soli]GHH80291.1 transcriptional regulator [Promicromonospora soli]